MTELAQRSSLIACTRLQVGCALHQQADQRDSLDPFENLAEPCRVGVKSIGGAGARFDSGLQIVQACVDAGHPVAEIQTSTPITAYADSLSVSMKHMHKAELDDQWSSFRAPYVYRGLSLEKRLTEKRL